MRYFVPLMFIVTFILFSSCKHRQDTSQLNSENFNFQDSLSEQEFDLNQVVYSVPSPHQLTMLVKEDYSYYEDDIFEKKIDINEYSTSERKALILGALCTDLGYLSLYDQRNLEIEYLNNIRQLVNFQKFNQYNSSELFKRIDDNLGNSDSILMIMSQLMRKENEAIRNGERPYLSTLIIAGGWIESFYIINTLYNNSKNSNLFGILLQQQYALDNLIQLLRPYYKKSPEYTELINKLVEIAYEFEVVDVDYKNAPAHHSDSTTTIRCKFTPVLTGSQLDKMFEYSRSLRRSIIY